MVNPSPDLAALDDEICRTYGAIHAPDNLAEILTRHGWAPIHETRQQVAEQIAAKLDDRHHSNLALSGGDRDIVPRDGRVGLATGYQRAAQIAREIGAQA
jgi:hypothetical protein